MKTIETGWQRDPGSSSLLENVKQGDAEDRDSSTHMITMSITSYHRPPLLYLELLHTYKGCAQTWRTCSHKQTPDFRQGDFSWRGQIQTEMSVFILPNVLMALTRVLL